MNRHIVTESNPYFDYEPGMRQTGTHIRTSAVLGGLSLFLFISLAGLVHHEAWVWGCSSATALTLIQLMRFAGAHRRQLQQVDTTRAGRKHRGFHLFAVESILITLFALALWTAVSALKLHIVLWQHLLLGLIVLLIAPLRYLQIQAFVKTHSLRLHYWQGVLIHLIGGLFAPVVAGGIHYAIVAPFKTLNESHLLMISIVWIPTILIIFYCALQIILKTIALKASPKRDL